jgi:hypothetical protein
MENNGINPQIKKMLESLQEVPDRDLRGSHTGREIFLAEAKVIQAQRTKQDQAAQKRQKAAERKSWALRFAGIFAVLVIALSSLGGTVYAAQASLPDDFLYPVKTLTEDIQIMLESDPEDRLDLYASFTNRRLAEIQAQVSAGEVVSDKALTRLEQQTEKMLQQAARVGGTGLEKALLQIQQNLQNQNQLMEKMGKEHPQGGAPGLLKAQEKIRERLELVENGIQEPEGFQEKMRERKENAGNQGQGNQGENGNSNKPDTPPGQENKDDNGKGKNQEK